MARRVRSGGTLTADLVNRTRRTFDSVQTGCVVQRDGKAVVVGLLFEVDVFDGVVGPGETFSGLSVLESLNEFERDPETLWLRLGIRDIVKPCPPEARFAVIRAALREGYKWSAEGTPWPTRESR